MVAGPAIPFRSANAGEFSPDASGRIDIKQYYSAGLAFKNVEPVPQSGFRDMGGTWRKGYVRKRTVALPITGASVSPGSHTGTQTIWSGIVAGNVACAYIDGLAVSAGTATFQLEAFSAGNWVAIGGVFGASTSPVSRMAARAPGDQVAATQLRIRATFSTSATVTIGSVTAFSESNIIDNPRYVALTTDDGITFSCFVTHRMADFFTAEDGFVGSASLSVSASLLPDVDFYAEASTIGVFHGSSKSERLFQAVPGSKHEWRTDFWPFNPVPKADLGGNYPKTPDKWSITIRWAEPRLIYLSIMVDGESTAAVPLTNATGTPVVPADADWNRFANSIATAINDLPSLPGGVTAVAVVQDPGPESGAWDIVITFGGDSSGSEYQLSATVTNTSDASALAYHSQVGKTELEDLFSSTRGWPGAVELVQDRMAHARIPAVPGSMAFSRVGEYFDFNTAAQGDAAARLDKLRSQTSELVVWIKESKYILAGTDRGIYFATNRTVERNTPLNFVLASEIGAQPNCKPFDLEGLLYYVAINPGGLKDNRYYQGGFQLLSLAYDDVSTSYNASPESLLASHLVRSVIRTARQKNTSDLDASKGWLMRADGRLVAGQIIKAQDITGFCEFVAADGGLVREIGVDGANRLWLAVRRQNTMTIEVLDSDLLLQDAITLTPDLAGRIRGVPFPDGEVIWAQADGYVVGPLTVSGGAVDLQDTYSSATIGRWQPPYFESMPQVAVTRNDDVILRPGRIHTAQINIMDTTSIAVGANGSEPADIPLLETTDQADAPMPGKTKLIEVTGEDLPGVKEGTTLVITQTKPGRLRVKDYAIGAKL